MIFDRCVKSSWKGETIADSYSKAKNNLLYQAKSICNLLPNMKVNLPGKLYLMRGGVD